MSLKGGMSHTEFLNTVEDARKGKKAAKEKLSKYVESGVITAEQYKELVEKSDAVKRSKFALFTK